MVFIFFRRSIWNELFYIIRFKELKKEVGPKWCWVNSHWYTNILFKNHATSRVKKHLFIDKSLFSEVVKHLLPAHLGVQQIYVLEKPMRFLTLDLKTKLITSKSIFRRSLSGMVVYNMLNSKAEIDLAFFLTLILFSLVAIGKNFAQPRISHSLNDKTLALAFYSIKNYFEKFRCCIREWLRAAVIYSYNKSGTQECLIHFT